MSDIETAELPEIEYPFIAGFNAAVYDTLFDEIYSTTHNMGFYADGKVADLDLRTPSKHFNAKTEGERIRMADKYFSGYVNALFSIEHLEEPKHV